MPQSDHANKAARLFGTAGLLEAFTNGGGDNLAALSFSPGW